MSDGLVHYPSFGMQGTLCGHLGPYTIFTHEVTCDRCRQRLPSRHDEDRIRPLRDHAGRPNETTVEARTLRGAEAEAAMTSVLPKKRKPLTLASGADALVLADDGTIWKLNVRTVGNTEQLSWRRLPDLPQGDA